MQAAPPVPGKTSNADARRAANIGYYAHKQTKISRTPSPIEDEHSRKKGHDSTGQIPNNNEEQTIIITQPPAVPIDSVWWNRLYVIFTGSLVIIGAAGIFYACRTLKTINKQSKLMYGQIKQMETQANIMTGHLKTYINAERSWVMVDIEWQKGTNISHITTNDGPDSITAHIEYICRNVGNSFAKITEKIYVFQFMQSTPEYPDFTDILPIQHACEYVPRSGLAEAHHFRIDAPGVRTKTNMLMLYGRVKYADVYGEYETSFGYQVTGMGNLERLPGKGIYSKYNEHT